MITAKEFKAQRDELIYAAYKSGDRQKIIAVDAGLSESRVKAIIAEQRKKEREA